MVSTGQEFPRTQQGCSAFSRSQPGGKNFCASNLLKEVLGRDLKGWEKEWRGSTSRKRKPREGVSSGKVLQRAGSTWTAPLWVSPTSQSCPHLMQGTWAFTLPHLSVIVYLPPPEQGGYWVEGKLPGMPCSLELQLQYPLHIAFRPLFLDS